MNPLLAALVEAGLLTQQDADRIERQLDPSKARDYAEGLLTQAVHAGLTQQQRRLLDLTNATEGLPTDKQLEQFWEGEDELLYASVGDTLTEVASEQSIAAAIRMTQAGITVTDETWSLINQSAIDWTQDYYISADAGDFGSIPNLDLTSKTLVGNAVTEWQRGELQTAGYADGLPELIRALEPAFGMSRATRIGTTEVSRIFAQSELFAARGNPDVKYLQWLTAEDERVCPLCGPRANRIVGKEENGFRVATDTLAGFPPIHVMCRCSLTPLTQASADALREQGMING